MEAFDAAKTVYNRILETESESTTRKVIGYIYLSDHPDHEMIRLAFGPDNLLKNTIQKAKFHLNLIPKPVHLPPVSPSSQCTIPLFQNHKQFNQLTDEFDSFDRNFSVRGRRDENRFKICHYFNRGYCKHGSNCRFFHGKLKSMLDYNSNEFLDDDDDDDDQSIEKLEFEIMEILKSRRGNPVSIASLPMIYFERYGKTIQAEGYLTESQRHGKAGYSLTKLLARLKNSIRLIDRPHGQHAVVLADDASRYMDTRYSNPGPIVSGSKQIYLTFPAESVFTEDDVANYFSNFGPVRDVRIPCQQKRMFGFVTFQNYETVQMVLRYGNPHYICRARVLVKPYREKLKLFDRKYFERSEAPMCCHSHHMEMDHDFQTRLESSRMFDRQAVEDHEIATQLEMLHLSRLRLSHEPTYVEYTFDDQKQDQVHDDHNFQSSKIAMHLSDQDNNFNDQERETSQGLNLPDSPFACNKGSYKQMQFK